MTMMIFSRHRRERFNQPLQILSRLKISYKKEIGFVCAKVQA